MREGNGDIVEDGVGGGGVQQERRHRTLCVRLRSPLAHTHTHLDRLWL